MKKIAMPVIFAALAVFALEAHSARVITAARTDSRPFIDGRLEEDCWREAEPVKNFTVLGSGEPAEFRTEAYVLFDDSALYIGFKCREPDIANIRTEERERDGRVFSDDCVEVMLDPWLSGDEYFHFAVNASGSIYDAFRSQGGHVFEPSWDGDWEAAAHIGEDYWSAEFRIPFHTLEATPDVGSEWRINLAREKKLPFPENSSIAEMGAFHTSGRFASLEGLEVDFSGYAYETGEIEKKTEISEGALNTSLLIPITNLTGADSRLRLQFWLIDGGGGVITSHSNIEIPEGGRIEAEVGPVSVAEGGDYRLIFSLKDAADLRTRKVVSSEVNLGFVPMAVNVIEPFYRDAVFETQNLDEIILDIEVNLGADEMTGKTLAVSIKDGEGELLSAHPKIIPVERVNRVEFKADPLPYGDLFVRAALEDSNDVEIASTSRRIRKLPYQEGEVWLSRDFTWHIDGKPFFPVTSWGRGSVDTNEYYNAEWAAREGKKRIFHMHYRRDDLRGDGLSQEVIDSTIERLKAQRVNPDLFAYHLRDEPGGYPVENFKKLYELMVEHDPYHPAMITHNRPNVFSQFIDCADWHTFHAYPPIYKDVRVNDLTRIGVYADQFNEINDGRKSVGTLLQGFNYGDYGQVNQRIHTYQEFRARPYMAIVRGVKSVIFYNRFFEAYPELYIGAPALARELNYLSDAVVAPVSELEVNSSAGSVKTLLKDVEGDLYLFAVNESMEPVRARIEIEGAAGRRIREMQVISEDRRVRLSGGAFTDGFDAFETHIYTTYPGKTGLPSIRGIEAEIAEANNARRKPGNLAFQMFESDGVQVTASSNMGSRGRGRADNGLWHLVNGTILDFCSYDVAVWSSETPNEFPDWVEVKLPEEHRIGRVMLYTPSLRDGSSDSGSARDYEVQVFQGGEWKTVDSVRGNTERMLTHDFGQVRTDRVRVWITAANEPRSRLSQIEIYE